MNVAVPNYSVSHDSRAWISPDKESLLDSSIAQDEERVQVMHLTIADHSVTEGRGSIPVERSTRKDDPCGPYCKFLSADEEK